MKAYFSIIIPTYNRGYIVDETIKSIQNQTFKDWELIVVDDNSTDNTPSVLAKFKKDKRIKFVKNKKNLGPSGSRNIGLEEAKGELIVYVDSDDPVLDIFLEKIKESYDRNPNAIFALCNHNRTQELYDKNSKLIYSNQTEPAHKGKISMQDIYHRNVHTCATSISHRSVVKQKGIRWDPDFNMFEDIDFVMEISKAFPEGFLQIPEILFNYAERYGTNSLCSQTTYKGWADAYEALYKKHKNDPLMKGQTWYPAKVKKYRKLQENFEKGIGIDPIFRYFPGYSQKD